MRVRREWRTGRIYSCNYEDEEPVVEESFLVTLESDKKRNYERGEVMELVNDGVEVKFVVQEVTRYKSFEDLLTVVGVETLMPGYSFEQALEVMERLYSRYTGSETVFLLKVTKLT